MPCEPGRAHQSRRELEEVREDPTHERSERSSKCFFESHQAISQGGQTRLPEQINGFVRPNCRPPMKARGEKRAKDACILRQPRPGDMGWVVHRHGVVYREEYGWNVQFEGLVAGIVAKFIQHHDAKRERCWMAEMNGEVIGSVFIVKKSEKVSQLRLMLVEKKARGLGLGTRLVNQCIRFSRRAGYQKIILLTESRQMAARHIYERAGFRLVREEPQHSFGHDLKGEWWELVL